MEPTLQEIEKLLEVIPQDSELVVLREKSSQLSAKNSLATIERAFVDLYYETTREYFPFSVQEVAYIFLNITNSIALNKRQMLRYASERSIRDDIQRIFDYPAKESDDNHNRPSSEFLNILSAIG